MLLFLQTTSVNYAISMSGCSKFKVAMGTVLSCLSVSTAIAVVIQNDLKCGFNERLIFSFMIPGAVAGFIGYLFTRRFMTIEGNLNAIEKRLKNVNRELLTLMEEAENTEQLLDRVEEYNKKMRFPIVGGYLYINELHGYFSKTKVWLEKRLSGYEFTVCQFIKELLDEIDLLVPRLQKICEEIKTNERFIKQYKDWEDWQAYQAGLALQQQMRNNLQMMNQASSTYRVPSFYKPAHTYYSPPTYYRY